MNVVKKFGGYAVAMIVVYLIVANPAGTKQAGSTLSTGGVDLVHAFQGR